MLAGTLAMIGRAVDPLVRTERIKLMAGGCQLIAVGTGVASFVAPLFNPALMLTSRSLLEGAAGFAFFELLALHLLRYLAPAKES